MATKRADEYRARAAQAERISESMPDQGAEWITRHGGRVGRPGVPDYGGVSANPVPRRLTTLDLRRPT